MITARMIRSGLLVLCVVGAFGCAPGRAPVASPSPPPPAAAKAESTRAPATERELARYAEREQQASGLAEFEGGRRRGQTTTIIIVLLIVIIILILI